MTPGMEARDITFRRRTTSIKDLLRTFWSERDYRLKKNPEEERMKDCLGPSEAADEMIFRLREVRTLDALESLVQYLRFVREERKAVIAITQGWRLYSDDPTLQRTVGGGTPVPGLGGGKCGQGRSLSTLRNDFRFRDPLRQANTGNISFYPVDPRGLVVFDEDIVPISPSGRWSPGSESSRIRGAFRPATIRCGRWQRSPTVSQWSRLVISRQVCDALWKISARTICWAITPLRSSTANSTGSPCA